MDVSKAAVIAKFAYTDLQADIGIAKIKVYGEERKYSYQFVEVNNTQCYILEDNADLIIVIRGSKEKDDYIDSLKSFVNKPTRMDRVGKVHVGFYECVGDIMGAVQTRVENTDKSIYFIGHSMGGSMAKLFGLYWKHLGVKVITFGEARSCKKKQDAGNSEFVRVVNNLDIVPNIHLRYNHGVKNETLIYFDRKGKEHINPRVSFVNWDRFCTAFLRHFKLLAVYEAVRDHRMDSYITLLS